MEQKSSEKKIEPISDETAEELVEIANEYARLVTLGLDATINIATENVKRRKIDSSQEPKENKSDRG